MFSILDRVAGPSGPFRPRTSQEFFALQLARKVFDVENVRRYLQVVEEHSEEVILRAYQKACVQATSGNLAECLHVELDRLERKSHDTF